MKTEAVEIINSAGTTVACYFQVSNLDSLNRLHPGYLMEVTPKGLSDIQSHHPDDNKPLEPNRFVVANDLVQKEMLQIIEPISCYLRDHDMNAEVIQVNPFQSVRWLFDWIAKQRNLSPTEILKLVVNEVQLISSGDSLAKYIHENAIIHIMIDRKDQDTIDQLLIKEPGDNADLKSLFNLSKDISIVDLTQKISELTFIPISDLHLVYGGKVMNKKCCLKDYCVQKRGSVVYGVDGRKYMKKISIMDYRKRLQQVRKVKPNNQIIRKKIVDEERIRKQAMMKAKNAGKSKDITQLDRNQEDYQYFNQQMKIDCEEVKDDVQKEEERLKQSRIKTSFNQIYQDQQGHVHQHHQDTYQYQDREKVVDEQIVQDNDGHVLQVKTDTIDYIHDQKGHVHEHQKDIIQEQKGIKVVEHDIERDQEGNFIQEKTNVFESQNQQDGSSKRHNQHITEQNNKQTIVESDVVVNENGEVRKIQTDICERQIDKDGNLHEHTKQILEENGVTTVIDRDIVKDQSGEIIHKEVDVTEIVQDECGNTFRHEHQQISEKDHLVTIDKDTIYDHQGNTISKETDVIEKICENQEVHIHQKDVFEENRKTTIIEKETIENQNGGTIHTEVDVKTIQCTDRGFREEENKKTSDLLEDGTIEKEEERIERQVQEDEIGNLVEHEKKKIQKSDGSYVLIEKDCVKDAQGNVMSKQKDFVEYSRNQEGNIQKKQINIVEKDNEAVFYENEEILKINPNGNVQQVFQQHTDTIIIESDSNGNVHKHQVDILMKDGNRTVVENDIIQDNEGNVVRAVRDQFNDEGENQNEEINQEKDDQYIKVEDENIETKVEVDENGNEHVYKKQITENNEGVVTVINSEEVRDKDGNTIKLETDIAETQLLEQGTIHKHETEIGQKDGRKVVIEREEYRNQGGIIEAHTEIVEIQKEGDTIHRHEIVIDQEGNESLIKEKDIVMDKDGNIEVKESIPQLNNVPLQENQDPVLTKVQVEHCEISETVEMKNDQVDLLEEAPIEVKVEVDEQGNTHKIQRQMIDDEGIVTVVETDEVKDSEGNVILVQTDIAETELLEDGKIYKHQKIVSEEEGRMTIIESQKLRDETGVVQEHAQTKEIVKQGDKYITHQIIQDYIDGSSQIEQRQKIINSQGLIQQQTVEINNVEEVTSTVKDGQEQNKQRTEIEQIEIIQDGQGNTHQRVIHQTVEVQNNEVKVIDKEVFDIDQNQEVVLNSQGQEEIQVVRNIQEQYVHEQANNNQDLLLSEEMECVNKVVKINEEGLIEVDEQKQTKKIEEVQNEDGTVERHQTVTCSETGQNGQINTVIVNKNIVGDEEGNIVKIETQVVEMKETEEGIEGKKTLTVEKLQEQQQANQNKMKITVTEIESEQEQKIDEEGNKHVIHNEKEKVSKEEVFAQISGEHPEKPDLEFTSRALFTEQITNKEGEVIKKQINQVNEQTIKDIEGSEQQEIHRQITQITEQENKIVEIQRDEVVLPANQNNAEELKASYTNIKETQRQESGKIHEHEMEIVEDQQQSYIYQREIVEDAEGNINQQTAQKPEVILKEQREHNENLMDLLAQSAESREAPVTSNSADLLDLLGLNEKEETQEMSNKKGTEAAESDLLGNNEEQSGLKSNISENVVMSQQNSGIKKEENLLESSNQMLGKSDQEIPLPDEFQINLKSKQGKQWKILVHIDDIIDEVAIKFAEILEEERDKLHFFFNGAQLNEYDMIAEINIMPGDTVYFLVDS